MADTAPAAPAADPALTKALASGVPRRSRRLDDATAADAVRIDVRMIHQMRKIAHGEALVDPGERRALLARCREAVAALGLPDEQARALTDLFGDVFKAGARSTINPMAVIKAFESLVRVGHSKIWTPPDGDSGGKGVKSVSINITTMTAPKQIEAPIEVKAIES